MTNDLLHQVSEHKEKLIPGFTSKYNINQPFNYEEYSESLSAIEREKRV